MLHGAEDPGGERCKASAGGSQLLQRDCRVKAALKELFEGSLLTRLRLGSGYRALGKDKEMHLEGERKGPSLQAQEKLKVSCQ